ncbi:MAG: IS200/IS605 family element transposase accessory protein TnpB [Thaumarchaeota archaeon]|nr:IS200/IS605 family element transposase accessory protein TnpB [Nitrososphaerota archaeon]
MLTTYRLRLYPTRTQERLLNETLETCRLLYNRMLADRRENHTGFYEQKRVLVGLKKNSKHLRAVNSQVLQDVVLRLDKTYQAFFAGLAKRPRFKRKARYNSFRYAQLGGFRVIGKALRLSKIGSVKMKLHRPIDGTPKTCTVIRDIDQWYACISAKIGSSEPIEPQEGKAVGVDLGVVNLATLSNGRTFGNPRHLDRSIIRLKTLQRRLSRKKKGSNNGEKAKVMLAKAWRRVRRQRDDTAHKVSADLASGYSTIVFEDLHIPNMVKNHNLASAITDASWGQLRRLTAYKAERRGGRVILVEPRGTSQKCSGCGEVVPKGLEERTHSCPNCSLVLDRDVNAARNILKLGLERARMEEQPLLVQRRRISKFAPVKQEAYG